MTFGRKKVERTMPVEEPKVNEQPPAQAEEPKEPEPEPEVFKVSFERRVMVKAGWIHESVRQAVRGVRIFILASDGEILETTSITSLEEGLVKCLPLSDEESLVVARLVLSAWSDVLKMPKFKTEPDR